MSALHSIKKNLRTLTPIERKSVDNRIIAGDYQSSRREIAEARDRIERAAKEARRHA